MEEIYFKEEARNKLLNGINKLHDAVASTMGPNGKTVIISDVYGKPKVTKDGVSVARAISFKDPVENMGAELIKEAAELTVDVAGDGTTTATVLATAFVNNLKEFESKDINKAFDEIIPKVIEQLKHGSKTLERHDIKHVATISANNDTVIGDIIQEAYNHSDIIKVEESASNNDILELVEGMQLDVSYLSKAFVNIERKAECELVKPHVLIIDGKLETLKGFEQLLNAVAANNESLLIITEHITEQVLRMLETNALSGNIKLCAIKSPGFGQHRKDLLKDIAKFTQTTIITDLSKHYTLNVAGKLQSVRVTKNNSILVKDNTVDVTEIINDLNELSKSIDLSEHDKDLIIQRRDRLTGKISIIKVGGISEVEMKERKDRYDDAVLAVACALEEGIVQGAGLALYHGIQNVYDLKYDDKTPYHFIMKSLLAPYDTICKNGVCIPVMNNMFEQNIIDPLKVTRCALENAVAVAKTILSTDTIILNERQWN
jgi:chaperonin GroEL